MPRSVDGRRRPRGIALGSAALTAWDLFLDPQMVGEGYWTWARRGVYRGIPLTNYLGWFVTGLGVMALLEALLPPTDDAGDADGALVGEYAYMGVMETIGFARYFRVSRRGDRGWPRDVAHRSGRTRWEAPCLSRW